MANLRKDKDIVGRFNLNGSCKKHPKHRQSPGVCSLCLRDRLSQLSSSSSSSSSRKTNDDSSCSSSLSSYYSSSSVSSCASPSLHSHHLPLGKTDGGSNSVSIFLLSAKHGGLVKSKSMAVVPRRKRRDSSEDDRNKKKSGKKRGFWSKLLHPKRSMEEKKGTNKVVRTRSLRETMTVATL